MKLYKKIVRYLAIVMITCAPIALLSAIFAGSASITILIFQLM